MSKTVFLGTPLYHEGSLTIWTMVSIFQATMGRFTVNVNNFCSSALPFSFNALWASALNQEPRPDYFVLLHSDVSLAEANWLDLMIDQLEAEELAVLSAVVGIKNFTGDTSTALANVEEGYDGIPSRLTWDDFKSFSSPTHPGSILRSGELDGALMINTGCMVVNLAKIPEPEKIVFTFRDWLQPHPDNPKKVIARMMPEDWHFSWWLYENNLPYAATTIVTTEHLGTCRYQKPRD